MNRSPVFLSAVGDANNISTWSGIPYHIVQAGKHLNIIDRGLSLHANTTSIKVRRILWNGYRFTTVRGVGGFQYSDFFQNKLWSQDPIPDHSTIIHCAQVFPKHILDNKTITKVLYLDQTLRQLFRGHLNNVEYSKYQLEAIAKECETYQQSDLIIMHSHWAANCVIQDYGIDSSKVHVVVPGANIDINQLDNIQKLCKNRVGNHTEDLRLIFVGRDWRRKGLDRLLQAFALLQKNCSIPCSLDVVGCTADDLPEEHRRVHNVRWHGLINKSTHFETYRDLMLNADVGVLLSRHEAGGIGLREYHAFGLAVIAPNVGGSPEHAIREAALLVDPQDSPETIATKLQFIVENRGELERLKKISRDRFSELTWAYSLRKIADVLDSFRK